MPMFNPGAECYRLLDALFKQNYPTNRFEILLIDDGSTVPPHIESVDSLPPVRIYTQKNKGSYAARNLGISHAQGDIIAFTDTDCIPESDWLKQGISQLIQKSADLVAGEIRFDIADAGSVIELYDINFHLRQRYYVEHHNFGVTANLFNKAFAVRPCWQVR
ncbi:MAG: glycosyltransferase family 2 protein [Candidatus Thiodiazotropha sp. (ex Lucinoma aequizonata)]|nr:glycosyltransferase family 2 protein [Candidatus Thiodiazotropha sp. (ex Lucinoma aequizonata)]MCU7895038.1 glycosyltransferase family 2 protein [Candidatus Thiodiazotropha sp. (ex Lucinoma aequizonata)]MCU7902179.1 glycosyltransferase family 2 protein [Candidatus Thiodiazotropha sp. (ex Lucinoma aequizonata)]